MVLENLIDNASKYTYEDKSITIEATRTNGSISIAISDEGVGMSPVDMDNLFRKFTRFDNPLSTTVGGTGLGLYWAKKIIDLHGGTISVTSELDSGSTFTVMLPV